MTGAAKQSIARQKENRIASPLSAFAGSASADMSLLAMTSFPFSTRLRDLAA
jgi:hypothetical protein